MTRSLPLLMAGLIGCATASPSPRPPQADERAVADLLQAQAEDWNRGDLEAFCAVYAEDARFLSPSGVRQGRDQILARYRAKYDTPAERGRLELDPIEARVRGDTVSVALRWRIERDGAAPAAGLSLVVLHRTPAGWRIVQDASM